MTRLNGFCCFYCALPVRFTGDHRHPGYVVIDHVGRAIPWTDPADLPDLRVLHRFCRSRVRATGCRHCSSLTLRRAWLGSALLSGDGEPEHAPPSGDQHHPGDDRHHPSLRPGGHGRSAARSGDR